VKRIGVLTGGGDTSALNATLKGVANRAAELGIEVVGFRGGWAGLLPGGEYVILDHDKIETGVGGTLLKTSRTKLARVEDGHEKAHHTLSKLGVEALIPIGGDDTLSVAADMPDVQMVVVTKTIDNDVGTNAPPGDTVRYDKIVNYFTPGFPSAAARVARFAGMQDGLRTTAYSHDRVIVMETMGMSAGWLALAAAYAHADFIIIPEVPLDFELLCDRVVERRRQRQDVMIVISEGARDEDGNVITEDETNLDAFGHAKPGGCAEIVASKLKAALRDTLGTRNFNAVIPSYLYRSGRPIKVDLNLGLKLGAKAVDLLVNGKTGYMACVKRTPRGGLRAVGLPFTALERQADGTIKPRRVDARFYDTDNLNITDAGKEYFRPILGPVPEPYTTPELDIRTVE